MYFGLGYLVKHCNCFKIIAALRCFFHPSMFAVLFETILMFSLDYREVHLASSDSLGVSRS